MKLCPTLESIDLKKDNIKFLGVIIMLTIFVIKKTKKYIKNWAHCVFFRSLKMSLNSIST